MGKKKDKPSTTTVVLDNDRWRVITSGMYTIAFLKVNGRELAKICSQDDYRPYTINKTPGNKKGFFIPLKGVNKGLKELWVPYTYKGVAKCREGDTYNLDDGIKLAKLRAEKELLKVMQRNEQDKITFLQDIVLKAEKRKEERASSIEELDNSINAFYMDCVLYPC